EETEEDEKDLKYVNRIADEMEKERIQIPAGPERALLPYRWLTPLRRFLRAGGRPAMLLVSRSAFAFGLLLGLVTAVVFLGAAKYVPEAWGLGIEFEDCLIVSMVMTLAVAAIVQWYDEKQAFGLHYRQYRRMRGLFLRHDQALAKLGTSREDEATAQNILRSL